MPFSEQIKLEVKHKAAFRCCRCQSIGVDVHHIIPEKDGGTDEISNAAPLCPSCHNYFGDNTSKRKEITQMRDWWYNIVKQNFTAKDLDLSILSQIDDKVSSILKHQTTDVSNLKSMLKTISDKLIDNMTASTASVTASGIVNTAAASSSKMPVHAGFHCKNCGTTIGLLIGSNECPNCGAEIN